MTTYLAVAYAVVRALDIQCFDHLRDVRLPYQSPNEQVIGPLVTGHDFDAVVKSLLASDITHSRHPHHAGEPGDPSSVSILVPKSVIMGDVNGFKNKVHDVCREGGACRPHSTNVVKGKGQRSNSNTAFPNTALPTGCATAIRSTSLDLHFN